MNPYWYEDMNCIDVDPRIFDGGNDLGGRPNQEHRRRGRGDWLAARIVCGSCQVQEECLEHVLAMPREWNADDSFAAGRTSAELDAERRKRARKGGRR